MRAWGYTAYDEKGRRRAGTVVAESEADASARLRAQGLHVAEIAAETGGGRTRTRGRARLTPELRAVMTRQMAMLLGAGLPAEQALEAVRQGGHPALDAAAARARAALLDGAPLSEALEATGGGWPAYYLASVRAGETSGDVAAVMTALADHLETLGGDRARISTALLYPAFVAAVSLLVCGILMTTVAPEIVAMFEMTDRPLPPLTLAMLAATDWIAAHWPWLAAGAGLAAAAWIASSVVPAWRRARLALLARLPVSGRMMRRGAAVQYLRTLALVLESRQPALGATRSAAEVLEVPAQVEQARAVTEAVRGGETLSSALGRLSIVPPVARQLIAAGEASARPAAMAGRAARMVEDQLSTERRRVAALLEPVLMMVVGGMVLVIVLAVLLPIFDLQAVVAG